MKIQFMFFINNLMSKIFGTENFLCSDSYFFKHNVYISKVIDQYLSINTLNEVLKTTNPFFTSMPNRKSNYLLKNYFSSHPTKTFFYYIDLHKYLFFIYFPFGNFEGENPYETPFNFNSATSLYFARLGLKHYFKDEFSGIKFLNFCCFSTMFLPIFLSDIISCQELRDLIFADLIIRYLLRGRCSYRLALLLDFKIFPFPYIMIHYNLLHPLPTVQISLDTILQKR
jgi:hypothetical protein